MKIVLPIKGKYIGLPLADLPPGYSGDMKNVRPVNLRGAIGIAQRPGLDKWSTDQIGASEQPIVALCVVSAVA